MKNNKGITMISLVITIIVLIIVASITIYNGTAQLGIKRVNSLYADIDSISTKVAEYYLKNEKLPVFENKYIDNKTNLEKLFRENGATTNITNANDGDDYYVLDLSKLDNLTLNYGDEYKDWTSTSSANDIQNIYIINSVTHEIYFPHGVRLRDEYYFARFPDENEISPIKLADIEDNWTMSITNISPNNIDENYISLVADITLNNLGENYNLNSLEYAWTETNDESELENISFSKFNVKEDKTATLASKPLSNTAEYYYLWIKAVDINGEISQKYLMKSASPLTGNLPSDYQRVEYIESTGEQWIDLDFYGTRDDGAYIEFAMTTTEANKSARLIGTRNTEKGGNGAFAFISSWTGDADQVFFIASNGKNTSTTMPAIDLNWHSASINVNNDRNVYFDEEFKFQGQETVYEQSKSCYLFKTASITGYPPYPGYAKVRLLKLYRNGNLVKNFIPCYKKAENSEDNKPGLYDIVEGKFYTNQGTGEDFTVGNDVY